MEDRFELTADSPKPKKKKPEPRERRQKHWTDKRFDATARFYENMPTPAEPAETHFRHSHWKERRSTVLQALERVNTNVFALARFKECGSDCIVEWSETKQKHRLRANYCHCRHCEPCMRAKANLIAANLRNKLSAAQKNQYRFVTLTLKHSNTPLADQIKRLYGCWRKLRNTKLWKNSQRGGTATLEVKLQDAARGSDRPTWHPHLHVITEGRWINNHELSATWHEITGDSMIVDVRAIEKEKDVCHYISKYITKGTSNNVWSDPDAAAEWIIASKGVRICATFGTWRGFKLTGRQADAKDWETIGRLTVLLERSRCGDETAGAIILKLRPPGDHDFDQHIAQ